MHYRGSCHCGRVKFEVDGEIESLLECNCSSCSKKGFLWWFVPRVQFKLDSGEDSLNAYTFNKHVIHYQFCKNCGTTPFAYGSDGKGSETAAVNARCLDGVDLSPLKIHYYDGRSV